MRRRSLSPTCVCISIFNGITDPQEQRSFGWSRRRQRQGCVRGIEIFHSYVRGLQPDRGVHPLNKQRERNASPKGKPWTIQWPVCWHFHERYTIQPETGNALWPKRVGWELRLPCFRCEDQRCSPPPISVFRVLLVYPVSSIERFNMKNLTGQTSLPRPSSLIW